MKNVLAVSIALVTMPVLVEPSARMIIRPGMKIDHLFIRNLKQPYILQRLTDRGYYFQRTFYSTTFYVGETGVLLFDALEGRGEQLLAAIREVTLLPVTSDYFYYFHFLDLRIMYIMLN